MPDNVVLFHGTLQKFLSDIQKQGLQITHGWGGAGTTGVFLSGKKAGALYWAKIAFLLDVEAKNLEIAYFDRHYADRKNELVILKIRIPQDKTSLLKADMEQSEDVLYEGEEDDWMRALIEIGDVRYNEAIPPEWISIIRRRNPFICNPVEPLSIECPRCRAPAGKPCRATTGASVNLCKARVEIAKKIRA